MAGPAPAFLHSILHWHTMKTFNLEGAAEFLRVSTDSLRDMADSGKVPAAKIGPTTGYRWVFTDEALEEYIREEIRLQTARRRNQPLVPVQSVQAQAAVPNRPAPRRRPAPPPFIPGLTKAAQPDRTP